MPSYHLAIFTVDPVPEHSRSFFKFTLLTTTILQSEKLRILDLRLKTTCLHDHNTSLFWNIYSKQCQSRNMEKKKTQTNKNQLTPVKVKKNLISSQFCHSCFFFFYCLMPSLRSDIKDFLKGHLQQISLWCELIPVCVLKTFDMSEFIRQLCSNHSK